MRGILTTYTILFGVGGFLVRLIILFPISWVSDLIDYSSILLKIGFDNFLISAGGDDMYHVAFYCDFMT